MSKRFVRLTCLTLAVTMTLIIAPTTALAGKYTTYRDIDVSSLNLYCEWSDVELALGSGLPPFKGKIRDITRQELDSLCEQVLSDMNKLAGDIRDAQKAYKKFDELATKLDGMAYGDGVLKAALLAAAGAVPGATGVIGTIGSAGAGIAGDAAKGDGGWTSAAENAGFAAAGLAAGLAAGPLGSIFVSLAQFGYNQYKLYDMKQEMEKVLQESRLYLDFLNRLKKKIAEYKKRNEVKNEIVFEKAKSTHKFDFYDTENWYQWELNMTLNLDESKTGGFGEHTYTGDFTIVVLYNMSGFLDNPRRAYNRASDGRLDTIDKIQGQSKWSTADYNKNGVAEIERMIKGKATAIVDMMNDKIDFKFEQNDDFRATNIANFGYTLSVIASAPQIGKFWDASGDFAFYSNYSGPDNPPITLEGQGETRYWIHPKFTEVYPLSALQEMWENNNKQWQKEITFDEKAWRPWDYPNPRAELRIMGNPSR